MANLIPGQTRHEVARSIYRDIITGKDFYYVFAGKSFGDTSTPVDTRHYLADIHRNMLLAKKIVPGPNDVVYMIRRKDWESGAIYDEYSDYEPMAYEESGALVVKDFYVMTDEYHIYKCLRAGKDSDGDPTPSTEKPTSTAPEPQELEDGYVWKFMYEVPVLDRIKFLTSEYIPVRNVSDGVNFDVNGVVESVRIENPGQGYTDPYLVIVGDGFAPSSIIFNGDDSVDSEESTIQYIGHNFITGDKVIYNDGGDTPIVGLVNNGVYYVISYNDRKIRLALTLSDAESNQYVEIEPGAGLNHIISPVGTVADVTVDGYGSVSSITITNSMRGYTHARAIMYDAKATPSDYDPLVEGSEFFSGTITADMESTTVLGVDTKFSEELEDGWTLTDHHNNIIGVIDNIINDTELVLKTFSKVDIPNEDYGAFAGGGFEGVVILGNEEASLINRNVVLDTVHGAIYKVDILNGGTGYDTAAVEVIGDGSGAELLIDPSVDITDGVITSVQIINYGQNYNYADVNITGLNTSPASMRVHVGPQRGHGFNIAQELYAHTICISATITTDNVDLFQGNDFRQLGVVKNLKLYNNTQDVDIGYLQEDTATAAFIISVIQEQYNEYNTDDEIESSNGGIYKVLTKLYDEISEEYKIYLLYITGPEGLTTDTTFTNNTTGFETLTCTRVIEPEFDKNTGTIIYVNEFSPVSRTPEQFETIKLFLHF